MHKSDLISFLSEVGASPRKDLSQNFLINPLIVSKIVDLAEIGRGDWVLEIGAGAGAITQQLLAKGAHVFAIEKDRLFAKHLERMQTEDNLLHIECCDFLKFPMDRLLYHARLGLTNSGEPQSDSSKMVCSDGPPNSSNLTARGISSSPKWKVVSNLPYQITAPILEILCDHALQFESATLVVQKEVGDRICAKPCTKIMGSLTIFLQFYSEFGGSFPISSDCFYPKPAVESMAIRLNFKHTKPPIDPIAFFPIVRKAFQQRRKMLTTSLKTVCPGLGQVLETLGLSSKARPEELTLDEWILVVNEMIGITSPK